MFDSRIRLKIFPLSLPCDVISTAGNDIKRKENSLKHRLHTPSSALSLLTPVKIVTDKSCYTENKDIINNRNVVMDPNGPKFITFLNKR